MAWRIHQGLLNSLSVLVSFSTMVDDGKIPTILMSGLLTLRTINVREFLQSYLSK